MPPQRSCRTKSACSPPPLYYCNTSSRYSGVAVDTWSLGVLLFLMLTGKYPFQPCPTRENMFKKICAGDFDVPGHVSQGARQVLSGLLQADPDKRMKLATVRRMRVEEDDARHRSSADVARHTSHVTRHTSHVTRHTSHVTRHTSHVTCHTSHVTRHTSHFSGHGQRCKEVLHSCKNY